MGQQLEAHLGSLKWLINTDSKGDLILKRLKDLKILSLHQFTFRKGLESQLMISKTTMMGP